VPAGDLDSPLEFRERWRENDRTLTLVHEQPDDKVNQLRGAVPDQNLF
jgi:hypothetical protein